MEHEEPTSPLENLRDRLYANTPVETLREGTLGISAKEIPSVWEKTPPPEPKKKLPFATIFLLTALGFFVLAGAIAAFLFLKGTRAISSDHIQITISGPTTIASGDTVPLTITVQNNNPVLITGTTLDIDFPNGTKDSKDASKAFDHFHSDSLGDIAAGGAATQSVAAILFGAQNQPVTIPVRFQYHTAGSNASFTTTKNYTFVISTSPVSIQVQTLSESASGQPLTVLVAVHSNAAITLPNIAVAAKYPDFGFAFADASPQPSVGSFYPLGTLEPGETKTIRITGVLTGEQKDERTFSFSVGTAKENGTAALSAPYTSSQTTVAITHPFLGTTLSLNQSTTDGVTVGAGTQVNAALAWQNNLLAPLSNATAIITLAGTGLDASSVKAVGGFYSSADGTILFSKENNPSLALLQVGDKGVGTFSFLSKSAAQLQSIQNPTITLGVSVAGTRIGQGNVPEKISSTVTRTIKVGTSVAFSRSLLHTTGPFQNMGPVPAKVDTETMYAIALKAANTINSVGAAKATMTLPTYVRFTGLVSPQSAITYDADSRTVSWSVGDIAPGVSTTAYFQVALLPSITQKNTSPIISPEGTFTGTDRFTGASVSSVAAAVTLNNQNEPGYTQSFGTVQ